MTVENGLTTSTVVITGGGSGIRAACARSFPESGARDGEKITLEP